MSKRRTGLKDPGDESIAPRPGMAIRIREWVTFGLALAGGILGLIGFLESQKANAASSRNEAIALLDEAWDLLGGEVGSTYIDEFVRSRRQLELADRKIEKALSLAPDLARIHTTKAAYFIARNKLEKALEENRRAAQIDPKWSVPHNSSGYIFVKQERWDEALDAFERAARIDPEDPLPPGNICFVLWKKRRLSEAAAFCQKSIALDPVHTKAYHNLAAVFEDQGKAMEAQNVLLTAARYSRDD